VRIQSHVCLAFLGIAFVVFGLVSHAEAQVEAPDRKYLFKEDKEKKIVDKQKRDALQQKKRTAEARQAAGRDLPFDVNAVSLSFDSTRNLLIADGNVLITYSSLVAEAQRAEVDVTNNQAVLIGDVRITDVTSEITADRAEINLETGSGVLYKTSIDFLEGGYHLHAEEARRSEGDKYSLKDALLSTCDCPDAESSAPWSLSATEAEVTREGYGFAWHTKLRVKDFPVLYWPYMIFPAKNERQTGFLPMRFGAGRQSGLNLEIPFFWAISKSSDATITALYESNVRAGVEVENRVVFSKQHTLQMGGIFLNEGARNGRLYGTDVEGLDDPTIDENRFGGHYDQSWKADSEVLPLQLIIDGAYTTDDLFIREIERDAIAPYNARFVTSTALLRAPIGDSYSADLRSEFNQAIVDDDDFVFQRLPEFTLSGMNSFRPFGENPLGAKVVLSSEATAVNFVRKESYQGTRSELYERARVPFHFRNFFDGFFDAAVRGSVYSASDYDEFNDELDADETPLDGSSNRVVPSLSGRLNSVVERVYDLDEGNPLRSIGELGRIGRGASLLRAKHTVEPTLRYLYVPDVDQDDTPQFDSLDRLSERNVVTYGVTQRILGRYMPRDQYLYGIEEIAPRPEDLRNLRSRRPLDEDLSFGFEQSVDPSEFRALRRGAVIELARLSVTQSYDINAEDQVIEDTDDDGIDEELAGRDFSDVDTDLMLFPNEHVRLRARSDFDVEEQELNSYLLEGQFTTKRGDSLRTRLRSVDDELRQLETSAEFKVTDYFKLGYYSRYDDFTGEFIEQKGGVRFSSECNCWVFDIDITDKSNPDETDFGFTITLIGLGEVGSTFFSNESEDDDL
jgi:LPS-assembly protein